MNSSIPTPNDFPAANVQSQKEKETKQDLPESNFQVDRSREKEKNQENKVSVKKRLYDKIISKCCDLVFSVLKYILTQYFKGLFSI